MIILCIPTISKYDLLEKLIISSLNGSVVPSKISIIDNGGNLPEHIKDTENVSVYNPGFNKGVATSWNWFLQNEQYPMLICNDDLEFGYNDLYNFLEAYKSNEADLYFTLGNLNMFSCFMPTQQLIEKVGLFDENFYPAYYEDNDYYRRMVLADATWKVVSTEIKHFGSATFKAYTSERMAQHHVEFNKNREYYIQKWGNVPGKEHYLKPFNRY